MRKTVKSPITLLAAAALTLALAGCGGDDSSGNTVDQTTSAVGDETAMPTTDASTGDSSEGDDSGDASTSDVCELLDTGTITSITGIDFSQAEVTDDGDGTCDWDLTSTGGLAIVSVIVSDNVESTFEISRGVAESMFDDVTDVSVSGVDHAFAYMGGMIVAMDFGGQYVQVLFMSLGTEATDADVPVKLAEEVASNW
jgi:hypothetical protein